MKTAKTGIKKETCQEPLAQNTAAPAFQNAEKPVLMTEKKSTRLHPNQSGLGEREWNEKIIITDRISGKSRFSDLISSDFENRIQVRIGKRRIPRTVFYAALLGIRRICRMHEFLFTSLD